jgi:hypothetical protein
MFVFHWIVPSHLPISRTTPISIIDLLDLVKGANDSAHDMTHDDVWLALLLMKEVDVANGKQWEELAVLVIDDDAVSSWQPNQQPIKSRSKVESNW